MYSQIICITNRIIYGGNITSKKKVFLSSYLCEYLLLLIFLSNNFGFICNNNTQLYFVKMHKTILSEYFFVSKSINKFAEATSDKQLLKLSKTCSILIDLASMSIQTLCFMVSGCHNSVVFVINSLSKIKVLCRYLRIFIHFSLFLWEIDDWKHCFVYIFIE